jgi:hypothetical protein
MGTSEQAKQEHGNQEAQPSSQEQPHAGNSGEGAASALAQLKTQTKQHRRMAGDEDDASGGRGQ